MSGEPAPQTLIPVPAADAMPGVWTVRRDVALEWMAAQPLLTPAAGLIAGIALDAAWHGPLYVILGAFAAAGLMLYFSRNRDGRCHLAVLIAAAAVGALMHDTHYRRWPADHLVQWCTDDLTPARLT